MRATVNGQAQDLPDGATVADVVVSVGRDPERPGAAVVVNDEIVPRSRWAEVGIDEEDRVEIVSATQGG